MAEQLEIDESELIEPGKLSALSEAPPRPAPGRKTATNPAWLARADGIWCNTRAKKPWLYERPTINGRPTFRCLRTTNLKHAKEELARRVTARLTGGDSSVRAKRVTTAGDVLRMYQHAGFPDKQLNSRPDITRQMEDANCGMLSAFWDQIVVDKIRDKVCDDYRDWRVKRLQRSTRGTRMVDLELNTLANAFYYAKRKDLIRFNPVADRPKYHCQKTVRHCRECMPADTDELHERAAHLFEHPRSMVLGFQYLVEAYTGLRTCEVLRWGEANLGTRTPDGSSVYVWRCKSQQGVNPYCRVHEGLSAVLQAHADWKAKHYPESQWFFPSAKDPSKPVGGDSLAHALARLSGKKVTSHGARAFYVTVRRSHGITDGQIAFEIGHTTGGSTLAKVYGGVPPNWLAGGGPKLTWLPKGNAAWEKVA